MDKKKKFARIVYLMGDLFLVDAKTENVLRAYDGDEYFANNNNMYSIIADAQKMGYEVKIK